MSEYDGYQLDEVTARADAIATAKRLISEGAVFLDTETTGIGDADEVCDLAVIDADGHALIDTLICPRIPISLSAVSVHGITNKVVEDAPSFGEMVDQLMDALRGRPVCIYNADFDLRLLVQSARACGVDMSEKIASGMSRVHCAMNGFAQFVGEWDECHGHWKWHKLSVAAAMCGVDVAGVRTHRALADAELCRRVVLHMANGGVR